MDAPRKVSLTLAPLAMQPLRNIFSTMYLQPSETSDFGREVEFEINETDVPSSAKCFYSSAVLSTAVQPILNGRPKIPPEQCASKMGHGHGWSSLEMGHGQGL